MRISGHISLCGAFLELLQQGLSKGKIASSVELSQTYKVIRSH